MIKSWKEHSSLFLRIRFSNLSASSSSSFGFTSLPLLAATTSERVIIVIPFLTQMRARLLVLLRRTALSAAFCFISSSLAFFAFSSFSFCLASFVAAFSLSFAARFASFSRSFACFFSSFSRSFFRFFSSFSSIVCFRFFADPLLLLLDGVSRSRGGRCTALLVVPFRHHPPHPLDRCFACDRVRTACPAGLCPTNTTQQRASISFCACDVIGTKVN